MLLIRESCYGRQRISLKIVIHTGYALSLHMFPENIPAGSWQLSLPLQF